MLEHYHAALTPRWTILREHPVQRQLQEEDKRFSITSAGRRSGKTEITKRRTVMKALDRPGRYGLGAPTWQQAKGVFWQDMLDLTPSWLQARKPSIQDMTIFLINGSEICVTGLDRPARIEGKPWHGWGLDEYANMKPEAWSANIRPTLAQTKGYCWFTGVPEGRNHYYDLKVATEGDPEWGHYTWFSADILDPAEVEAARRTTDELTFQQEYMGSFVNFHGQAYYTFGAHNHGNVRERYNPAAPLIFCFDFNVEPGVCAVVQELPLPGVAAVGFPTLTPGAIPLFRGQPGAEVTGTAVIGEVYIPRNSNTVAVCKKLVEQWGSHRGEIHCYGDATGGARGSARVEGSDWDLIKRELRAHFGVPRTHFHVQKANPSERSRVNAMNTRCRTQAGIIALMVDVRECPNMIRDLEGVRLLEGGSGEIDKKHDMRLSHISDALGYYVVQRFPTQQRVGLTSEALRI
jgi:hypothetical protein